MPALLWTPDLPGLDTLRDLALLAIRSPDAVAVNNEDPLNVVCAWPVSGQYGPGSRVLYVFICHSTDVNTSC